MHATIRKAEKKDAPIILEFIHQLAVYEKMEHEVNNTVEKIESKLFGEQPLAHALMIENKENTAIGFAIYFFNYSTFTGDTGLYLEDFFIKKDYRRAGIGKQVFNRLIQIAKKHDCARIDWVVLDWNQPAINFYNKLKAKPMHDWIPYRLTKDQF